jgi:hypothetical protein
MWPDLLSCAATQGIEEWKLDQDPRESLSMMQAAEVVTLVHGLHHTFLRLAPMEDPTMEDNRRQVSVTCSGS